MKKKTIKKLEEIAGNLAPATFKEHQVVLGAKLIEDGVKEINGKKVNPKENYHRWIDVPVNHLERLKVAFKAGGQDAVSAYCGQVTRDYANRIKKARDQQIEKETEKVV
jgi:hypothetical protein